MLMLIVVGASVATKCTLYTKKRKKNHNRILCAQFSFTHGGTYGLTHTTVQNRTERIHRNCRYESFNQFIFYTFIHVNMDGIFLFHPLHSQPLSNGWFHSKNDKHQEFKRLCAMYDDDDKDDGDNLLSMHHHLFDFK